ncbi:MAG TPA: hypothetical protein VN767_14405 [Streptosporangiaceae bacterium]|nr:hypothetical protein [Streptosporangiaceae bacterium]
MTGSGEVRSARTVQGLRANSLAALLMLLLEYGLGVWVNLYGNLPASDNGASLPAGFARAVADGPVGLSIHAVLGAVLIVSAVSAVVRTFLARRPVLIGTAIVGLAAVAIAALSGARFVGHGTDATSMSMAIAAGVAIGAYAFMLFPPVGVRVLPQKAQGR